MPELDDDEEDDHFDPNDNYEDEVWKGFSQEQIKQFKILGARLEKEEVRRLIQIRYSVWGGVCLNLKNV